MPSARSPGANFGSFERTTAPTVPPVMTSPIPTGFA
jgi:hypothetical protein